MTTEVNRWVYQRLTAALSAVPPLPAVPVFDVARPGQALPYVQISRVVAAKQDRLTDLKRRWLVTLAVWSAYSGQAECLRIMGRIRAGLHRRRGDLTDDSGNVSGRVVLCSVLTEATSPEPDGLTFMGQVSLEILTEQL